MLAVSVDRSAISCHSYRLHHSVSFGQMRISLAIAIAFEKFAERSEEGGSPVSLKHFTKQKLARKFLVLRKILESYVGKVCKRPFISHNTD